LPEQTIDIWKGKKEGRKERRKERRKKGMKDFRI
jgi:hypothetical protein